MLSSHLAFLGIFAAAALPQIGAAYGTSLASAALPVLGDDVHKVFKGMIPIVMSGVLGIYGLLGGFVLSKKVLQDPKVMENGARYLAAGLTLGLSCVASGYAIGQAGHAGIIKYADSDEYFIPLVCSCIFAEALGLYGAIIAWFLIR